MGSIKDSFYLKLPRSLQNLAITLYGRGEFDRRYNTILEREFRDLPNHPNYSSSKLAELQNARLQQIVCHAAAHVPYYRTLFQQHAIDAKKIDLSNFHKTLPPLDKKTIVAAPETFVSEQLGPDALKLFTSGTSGSPMPIACSSEARATNYAFFRQLLLSNGHDVRDRSATFAGRVLFSNKEKQTFWRKDRFNQTLLLSSYHISDATIPLYLKALEKWQPKYMDSYPSAISEIARFINERSIPHRIAPDFILTSSETLTELQREHITRAFNCPIVDHFGCTEMAISAHAKNDEKYRIEPMYSLVEFEPSEDGNFSSLVCTGLLNMAMPLIRYRIGDSVSGADIGPAGDFSQRSFEKVQGRNDDLILTPDGRRIGRLDPAFKGLEGIKLAQIIQLSIHELRVLVVPLPSADKAAIKNRLEENLKQRTHKDMLIYVEYTDKIALTRSGKFKSVISQIKQ